MNVRQPISLRQVILQGTRIFDIFISNSSLSLLEHYHKDLLVWNHDINLTSVMGTVEIAVIHFLDSLCVLKVLPQKSNTLLDIGTGAGFPGLVLKIASPNLELWLLDTNPRKIIFLKHVVFDLQIQHVHFLAHNLLDPRQQFHGASFDVIITRAVAFNELFFSELSRKLSPGGVIIRMFGPGSFGSHPRMSGFDITAVWSGYLPFVPVYRKVVVYKPTGLVSG